MSSPWYEKIIIVGGSVAPFLPPEQKATFFNLVVGPAVDILAADIAPTNTPARFRIYVAFNAAGIFSVQRRQGGVTVAEQMNAIGNAVQPLVANCGYMFEILVDAGDTINFQHSVGATVLKLIVMEV